MLQEATRLVGTICTSFGSSHIFRTKLIGDRSRTSIYLFGTNIHYGFEVRVN